MLVVTPASILSKKDVVLSLTDSVRSSVRIVADNLRATIISCINKFLKNKNRAKEKTAGRIKQKLSTITEVSKTMTTSSIIFSLHVLLSEKLLRVLNKELLCFSFKALHTYARPEIENIQSSNREVAFCH